MQQSPVSTVLSRWNLTEVEKRIASVVLLLALVARWQALSLGYTPDDLAQIVPAGPDGALRWTLLSQGRALSYLLCLFLSKIGAFPPHAAVVGQILMHVSMVWCGLMLSRLCNLTARPFESFLLVSAMTLHPYVAEIVAYRFTPLFFALALFLATWALLACNDSRRQAVLACLALAASLLIYQVIVNFVAAALLLTLVFFLRDGQYRAVWGAEARRRYWTVACACIVYFVSSAVLPRLSHIAMSQRSKFIGFHDVPGRIHFLIGFWRGLFLEGEPILPLSTKVILGTALLIGLAGAVGQTWRTRHDPKIGAALQAWLLALTLGLPLCTGVIAVLADFWPAPRVLAHSGMLWGGMLALSCRSVPERLRGFFLTTAGLLIFSFLGLNNVIFNDQLRLNARDFANANRMLGRIETVPGTTPVRYLVLDGGYWAHPSPVASVQTGLNVSALYVHWSKVSLFNELSGAAYEEAPLPIKEQAHRTCQTLPKWPAPESVARVDQAAVVCLGP